MYDLLHLAEFSMSSGRDARALPPRFNLRCHMTSDSGYNEFSAESCGMALSSEDMSSYTALLHLDNLHADAWRSMGSNIANVGMNDRNSLDTERMLAALTPAHGRP